MTFMPLVNQLPGLMGGGPLATAAMGAAAGLYALAKATEGTIVAMGTMRATMNETGSNPNRALSIQALSRTLGMGDGGEAANAFYKLAQDPNFTAMTGIKSLAGLAMPPDIGKFTFEGLERLRKMPKEQAKYALRIAGGSEFAGVLDMSDEVFQSYKNVLNPGSGKMSFYDDMKRKRDLRDIEINADPNPILRFLNSVGAYTGDKFEDAWYSLTGAPNDKNPAKSSKGAAEGLTKAMNDLTRIIAKQVQVTERAMGYGSAANVYGRYIPGAVGQVGGYTQAAQQGMIEGLQMGALPNSP